MVKSGELFVKIGSRLQIALFFLFYWNVQPLVYSDFPVYLILPNVPTPRFLGPPLPPPRSAPFIPDLRVLLSIMCWG